MGSQRRPWTHCLTLIATGLPRCLRWFATGRTQDRGAAGGEADQHGDKGRVVGRGGRPLPGGSAGGTDAHSRRVRSRHRLPPQACDPVVGRRGQAGGETGRKRGASIGNASPTDLWRRGPGRADPAVGGCGPCLLEAAAADGACAAASPGAAWSRGAGRCHAGQVAGGECCQHRPPAGRGAPGGWRRAAPSGGVRLGGAAERAGADVQRLGRPGAGLGRGGLRGARRHDGVGGVRADDGADGRGDWLDGVHPARGARGGDGRARPGPGTGAVSLSVARGGFRQRQPVHERPGRGLVPVGGAGGDALAGVSQERPGVG